MWPVDDPVRAGGTVKGSTPPKPAASSTTTGTHASAPPVVKPTPDEGASAGAGVSDGAGTRAPSADMKPIDRIHAATVQAAKDQDLVALRQLKTTWKNLVRTIVGPDRSRTQREYAECLWHIQALTGRSSDQRETLAAYRDFLLSAPAGGTDARSAARLRELEDALAERH